MAGWQLSNGNGSGWVARIRSDDYEDGGVGGWGLRIIIDVYQVTELSVGVYRRRGAHIDVVVKGELIL